MVHAFYKDMPAGIKGFTIQNEDDSYTVILNSRLSYETIRATKHHELIHITDGDFDKLDVQEIESKAHDK